MEKRDRFVTYFFIMLFLAMLVLSFFIIKPFLITILSAIVISYIFYPVYKFFLKYLKSKNLSALLVVIIIIVILTVPFIMVLNAIQKEARVNYLIVKQKIISGNLLEKDCNKNNSICNTANYLRDFLTKPKTRYYIETTTTKFSNLLVDQTYKYIFSIPVIFVNFFIMMFIVFYLLKDAQYFVEKVEKVLPLKKSHQEDIFKKFNNVTFAVLYGHILLAFVQGIIGGLGFYFFGLSSPILWGIVMGFFALIPYVGTPIIWVPASLYMVVSGYAQDERSLIVKGIFLFLYGFILIAQIDNILKPWIIGDKAKVHPILIMLGVIGGLSFFGFIGIVVGPLVLAILTTFIRIYEEEKGI